MKKIVAFLTLLEFMLPVGAQTVLTLDSCRAMALRNNKQLNVSKLNKEVAYNIRKSARTQYLPKVDVIGGYSYFSKEISLLSNKQKAYFNNLGTNIGTQAANDLPSIMTSLVKQGAITSEAAQQLNGVLGQMSTPLAQAGNNLGKSITDALKTDTKNIWSGSVLVRQPIYMGGAIIAANKIADIGEKIANDNFALQQQSNIYSIDQTYWTVVSLKQKQKLALCYRDLVSKLDSDVYKMVRAGVATHADKLKVDVKVNEADMDITEVNNGLSLSKMLLCQLCGMKLDDKFTLADEENETLDGKMEITDYTPDSTFSSRPEIRMLQNAIEISKQNVIIARAAYMPHVALTGGYLISNPNVWNGFQRKFSGVWNVGITVQMSVWNWFEGTYNVRASKAASQIAQMQLDDTREKIELQITQSRYKVNEAQKRLLMANQDMKSAEENLRCANIGFKEGVIDITNVMAAQTAWQRAKSQQIDAEVEVKLTQVGLNKALGILQ